MLYASSAWWGFTSLSDLHGIEQQPPYIEKFAVVSVLIYLALMT